MDISRIAAKQKRLMSWLEFAEDKNSVRDEGLRKKILEQLLQYKKILSDVWQRRSASEVDELTMANLERQLAKLNEDARLTNA